MNIHRHEAKQPRQAGTAQARELAALTRELSRCCLDKEERICRTLGLHAADGRVLMAIYGEGLDTASDLAERLRIGNSRMTPLIDRMVKQGLLIRVERGDDRRVRRLGLTDAGRIVARRLQDSETGLHQKLLSRFPESERGPLLESLRTLRQAMDDIRKSIEI